MSESFVQKHSQPFVLHRDGEPVGEVAGVKGDGRITFAGTPEVFVGDWLEDASARSWLHVTDVNRGKLGSRLVVSAAYETGLDYRRKEAASVRLTAMLDDVADAIWTLSDKKMPPARKNRAQDLLNELGGILRTLPQPVASQLAGKIASHFVEGG